ncbi:hypothetical protein DSO57_1014154 [Entomophthora muscae]|uniref:Uncharacterized protein n=1 Tax=Entomophthora muscae TaxID=34485 RepID=A0ACC2RWI9_9FUNG|nr:hypothetical protein DSO57_1014154 [Entomophthora muscae]
MRYPGNSMQSSFLAGFEENRGSPLSSALQELLSAIQERSIEAGHRSRNLRRRSGVSQGPVFSNRPRRKAFRLSESKTVSVIKGITNNEYSISTRDFPLNFDIVDSDGGDHDPPHTIMNILQTDSCVYSSKKKSNINVILKFNPVGSGVSDSSCVITSITIRSPSEGFTAPCTDCLIFLSHTPLTIEDLAKYDDFEEIDFESSSKNPIKYGWPIPNLPPAAYVKLRSSLNFTHTTKFPHRSTKFIGLKLLRAGGLGDNIDLQSFSVSGFTGARSFAQADMI